MISRNALFLLLTISPFIIALFVAIRRNQRLLAKTDNLAPFEPTPTPVANSFFRRFTYEQRVFLRTQMKSGAGAYAITSWIFFFILLMPLFVVKSNEAKWFNQSAYLWYRFVLGAVNLTQAAMAMIMFLGIFVLAQLRAGSQAVYYRTRPLSIRFLFWSKVAPMYLGFLLGLITAMGLAYAFVLATHAHIGHNLPASIPRILGPDDSDVVQEYAALLVTSLPGVFLSVLTTFTLEFTFMLFIASLPIRLFKSAAAPIMIFVPIAIFILMVPLLFTLFDSVGNQPLHKLFIYNSLGPPPRYIFALVPIALSICFITFARFFIARCEV